jgi:hypothetical protein
MEVVRALRGAVGARPGLRTMVDIEPITWFGKQGF